MNKINTLKILIVALTSVLGLMNFNNSDVKKGIQNIHSEIMMKSM